jgi:hypothetical protein
MNTLCANNIYFIHEVVIVVNIKNKYCWNVTFRSVVCANVSVKPAALFHAKYKRNLGPMNHWYITTQNIGHHFPKHHNLITTLI